MDTAAKSSDYSLIYRLHPLVYSICLLMCYDSLMVAVNGLKEEIYGFRCFPGVQAVRDGLIVTALIGVSARPSR